MNVGEILSTVFWALLLLAAAVKAVQWIKLELTLYKNSRAEVESCAATVYYKDPELGYLPQGRAGGNVYFLTFHTDQGDILKLGVNGDVYYTVEEGDRGLLTWQGERFWKFEKD